MNKNIINSSMRVLVAGDLYLRHFEEIDQYLAGKVFEKIQPILQSADVRIANLESVLLESGTPIAKSGPNLKSAPQTLKFLDSVKLDCVTLANNHIGDWGQDGVFSTLRLLNERKIGHTGAGRNDKEARVPWTVRHNGLSLCVITQAETEFGTASMHAPGSAGLDLYTLNEQITQIRNEYDFILVIIHGDNEHNPLPSPEVKKRYRTIINMGADAVIGMHPHCPQGYEYFQGKPIVYSTGNFLFKSANHPNPKSSWYYGYIPVITFSKEKALTMEIHPYRFNPACTCIDPLKDQEYETMLSYLKKISDAFADSSVHERLFMGWCMTAGPGYAASMIYRPAYLENPELFENPQLLALRNLWTCQAHNELMRGLLKIITDQRQEEATIAAKEVRQLQEIPTTP